MGAANTISAACNASLLLFALRKKVPKLELGELRRVLGILFGSALASGFVAWTAWRFCESRLGHRSLPTRLVDVFGPMLAGGLVFWLLALAAGIPAARDITGLFYRRFRPIPSPGASAPGR